MKARGLLHLPLFAVLMGGVIACRMSKPDVTPNVKPDITSNVKPDMRPETTSGTTTTTTPLLLRRSDVMKRPPDSSNANARVWTMRQTPQSRTNLVEMRGRLAYHQHPDAEHTLLVLEGRVCAWHGREAVLLDVGDYFSIPAGVPHKYETITPTALLLSFDAPAYDPSRTVSVSESGVDFAPCPLP